jgi:uncharacterized membrane protein YedE/YeeE
MRSCFRSDRTLKPIFAAVLMGAVVGLSLLWTQAGIHVSGVFSLLCPPATVEAVQAPNALSCSIHSSAADKGWIAWMVCGIFAGAFLTSFWRSSGLRFAIERGNGVRPLTRLVLATAGGLVVGVGSALAGGCTSSIGLTGSALFSVAAFAFLAVFFLGGFVTRIFFGKFWNV